MRSTGNRSTRCRLAERPRSRAQRLCARLRLLSIELWGGNRWQAHPARSCGRSNALRDWKKAAGSALRSQRGEGIYRKCNEIMENLLGREIGVTAAEASVTLDHDNPKGWLPGLG